MIISSNILTYSSGLNKNDACPPFFIVLLILSSNSFFNSALILSSKTSSSLVFIIHISPLKSLKSPLSKVTFSAKSKAIPHRYIAFPYLLFHKICYIFLSICAINGTIKITLIFFKAFLLLLTLRYVQVSSVQS